MTMNPSPASDMKQRNGIYTGPKTLSVMLTYTCPAQCKDCGTVSSPHDRTNLNLDTILRASDEAAQLGFDCIVFTGGEPTLRWKDLLVGIGHAHGLGLATRLATNAHWATTLARARSHLDELIEAGLGEINYSTGDEHVRFIPLDRVMNATVAALECSLEVFIMVELREARKVTKADILKHPKLNALTSEQQARLRIGESPWMPLNPGIAEKYPEGVAVNSTNIGMRTGCDSVLSTFTLQADGRIGACCGLGLRITPELNVARADGESFLARAIEEAENDFLKIWIRYKGPEKIIAWAAEKDPDIKWEDMYAHRCQACLRMYKDPRITSVIREHYTEIMGDVMQCILLDEIVFPQKVRAYPS